MKQKYENYFKKRLILNLLIFLLLACSSESIFSQLGNLQKISHEYNILGSSSPRGISLVGETLYIAAMNLFKKEKGKIEKIDLSNSYEFINDIVNISGKTYLLAQNKQEELEVCELNGKDWTLKFKKPLKAYKFLKSVGRDGVKNAYILAIDKNNREKIFDLQGTDKTPSQATENDKFFQISNEDQLITGNSLKIWQMNNNTYANIDYQQAKEIMPIIKTSIRGSSEILVMTGGYNNLDTKFKVYSSANNYTTPIFNQDEVGEFSGYFAREFNDAILIGSNNGFAEFTKNKDGIFALQAPSKSVEPGVYNGSQLSKTGLNDIIPVSSNTIYILTQGKGLWKLENRKLTKE
ncbi:outer membrane protein assembly factor BamB [Borreliella carolinensis]|uniref:Outer membrane protein assembly factor BamB n=1 Tax=Borreliella carolinensis TaxID=478174 RepID=A0ABY9E3A5_9SPIR|nr:outer membrane protein assembly factor BamB [Borreliella carolinensis]WKC90444.1 outer membrane protein assembly factor BamB [Borreliella carolinensis]WNY67376.1 outer membrane protein assembly factor BamB [Borreliella carolinensis]